MYNTGTGPSGWWAKFGNLTIFKEQINLFKEQVSLVYSTTQYYQHDRWTTHLEYLLSQLINILSFHLFSMSSFINEVSGYSFKKWGEGVSSCWWRALHSRNYSYLPLFQTKPDFSQIPLVLIDPKSLVLPHEYNNNVVNAQWCQMWCTKARTAAIMAS